MASYLLGVTGQKPPLALGANRRVDFSSCVVAMTSNLGVEGDERAWRKARSISH